MLGRTLLTTTVLGLLTIGAGNALADAARPRTMTMVAFFPGKEADLEAVSATDPFTSRGLYRTPAAGSGI